MSDEKSFEESFWRAWDVNDSVWDDYREWGFVALLDHALLCFIEGKIND